ncbi:uncharacterized protein GLRG_04001 [Colletotrichum graminicola M1.001]|uniref:Uncharacterized protein n=1 Tax=Colletotrichum graminicola (strain M1.001 / M2 / FGSC 10212) TaxID=645133 RepID=E3QD85_COLGM|nr:uncharacterized protein GLRG_04001 [Colletotrichum graminicola M1.001]EFQ28857.1 hypothetical protein GLRG_04001 [Colletotrichum graminicola M1.001]
MTLIMTLDSTQRFLRKIKKPPRTIEAFIKAARILTFPVSVSPSPATYILQTDKSRPRFPRRFPGRSADQGPDIEHNFPNDIPLPSTGCAMEIPDDMSDSNVHNLLIPGYDDYVPWRKTGST